ncbi:MAG TPA: class I tRNA ligase family protein, partial [Candidatus Saccharimonadales bacterium]|nr:class I tRNA ligase family protein [Candidatus Saccharimonadales bacterium]
DPGVLMNSGEFDGQKSEEARENIVKSLADKDAGKMVTNYKIRDWLISRQRYWGAPIPMIHCEKDGVVPVPDEDLPVKLPKVESYAPTGEGTSVLASVKDWVNVKCPKCGGPAKRETDTMDGFACSSWYFLRFADPHNSNEPFAKDKVKFWLPVDDYIGGAEHAVMHLLYARMWTKVMHDAGLIDFDEPFLALRNQGMILAPDGRKMSKSWGNTITPDEIIEQGYGADAIRVMELFIGPWDQMANWSVEGMGGCYRFLQRVWTLVQEYLNEPVESQKSQVASPELQKAIHAATKKVTEDFTSMGFNTAIAALMECVNELYKIKKQHGYADRETWQTTLETIVQLLAPFAPHIAEELWHQLGHEDSVHLSNWPQYDEKYLVEDTLTIAVQVNGKLRGEIAVAADASEDDIVIAAKANERVAQYLDGKEPRKTIYVPGKIVNFVI